MELLKKLNGLQEQRNGESDSFVMDMERFSHLVEEDINAITRVSRNLSKKGVVGKGGNNKKCNQTNLNEPLMLTASSLRGIGNSTPEKLSVLLANRDEDHPQPQAHHQITITSCSRTPPKVVERKLAISNKLFRRSPKRILLFFATLSSTGTMLLLYFTLSMSNPEYGSSISS